MKSVFRMKMKKVAALCAALVVVTATMGQTLLAQKAPPAPAGPMRVWTCDVVSDERTVSASGTLRPVSIVGTRNGTFSGKVVVDSPNSIKGLKASVSAISGPGGSIPAGNVQLRYATYWEDRGWARPSNPDILQETPPAQFDPIERRAYAPVWITIRIPKDAKPGSYSGEVTVQAQGLNATKVPIKLEVQNWTLPDPQDYRTWVDFMESPDTLAVEYKVPLWSDQHWKLIDRSFKLLSDSGNRVVYIPLICHTNLGNEQSMVRWIPRGDNRYEFDLSVMDKYLDSAEKNLGKPKLVIFQVWDICMSKESLKRGLWDKNDATGKARAELLGEGPRVTSLDPKTKEAGMITLASYEDPASKALWGPLWKEINKKMVARHLENTMMLGLMPDLWPTAKEANLWKDITGGIPWAIHGHAGAPSDVGIGRKGLYGNPKDKSVGSDIGYAAFVYNLIFNANTDKGRMYGWQDKGILSSYLRGGELNMSSAIDIREYPAFNITGGQRGIGRMGGDFWPVLKNKKGERQGAVYVRYPENNWRNLDISDWFLAPGTEGALSTVRLECLKEGLEECEARIAIESALLDAGQKARLGDDLAKRAQDGLDEFHHAMWKTVWDNDEDLAAIGKTDSEGRNPPEGLWNALNKAKRLPVFIEKKTGKPQDFWGGDQRQLRSDQARKGQAWFVRDWQARQKKLFDLAGEVAAKLGPK